MMENIEIKLIEMIAEMKEQIGSINQRTEQILEQTQKTNGRVTKLECRVSDIEKRNDNENGAKQVKKEIDNKKWDIQKMFLNTLISGTVGGAIGYIASLIFSGVK